MPKIVTTEELLARRAAKKAGSRKKRNEPEPPKELPVRRSEKNRRKARMRTKEATTQSLEALLHHLNIGPEDWDFLMVGDGSGTTLDKECGSACVLVERESMSRTSFGCTLSHGTNIMAEIFAYVVPLLYLTHNKLKRTPRGARVHIVTDCQHLAMAWSHKHSRKKNRELWSLIESFSRRGVVIKFHWVPRDTWDLNRYADALAGIRRKSQNGLLEQALKMRNAKSIYDINPMTE